jgi:hypothetical protein
MHRLPLIWLFTAVGWVVAVAPSFTQQNESARSWPPDTTPYARAAIAEDNSPGARPPLPPAAFVADTVVNNTDPNLTNTDMFGDTENSIAVNPENPSEIVITGFSGSWGPNAPIWHSIDGGNTWTKRFTVPAPPGVPNTPFCPCDQAVDYGRASNLAGAFLTSGPENVYSGTTSNPDDDTFWNWFVSGGTTQRTNSVPNNADQPWLLVGADPFTPDQDNIYVAYDDFSFNPRPMRVAVAQGTSPPDFSGIDNVTGFSAQNCPLFVNPGHRLAVDPASGAVYSLFQRCVGAGAGGSQHINYMLNRSTDGGLTWGLNGSATGAIIAEGDSTQPTPKFGGVNALLGGVLHAAVDPSSEDIYYVYGNRDPATGNNRLSIAHLQDDGAGGLAVVSTAFVTGQVQAAIPSVAVAANGTVGVFYYTFNGIVSGFPQFTAHLATSTDGAITFSDTVLETFLSSALSNSDGRQRVLGDYMQLKAVGNTFYGVFNGNGVPFGRPFSNHDPIFYSVSVDMP